MRLSRRTFLQAWLGFLGWLGLEPPEESVPAPKPAPQPEPWVFPRLRQSRYDPPPIRFPRAMLITSQGSFLVEDFTYWQETTISPLLDFDEHGREVRYEIAGPTCELFACQHVCGLTDELRRFLRQAMEVHNHVQSAIAVYRLDEEPASTASTAFPDLGLQHVILQSIGLTMEAGAHLALRELQGYCANTEIAAYLQPTENRLWRGVRRCAQE